MKKLFTFAMMLLFAATVFAQNNDRISYQAVVRTSDNVLVYDQDLTVTIAIANSESGSAVYGEQHNVHSNANGLISLMIGTMLSAKNRTISGSPLMSVSVRPYTDFCQMETKFTFERRVKRNL